MESLGWKCESLRLPSMGSLRIDHVTEPEQCLGRNSWRYWQRQSRRWTFCEVREQGAPEGWAKWKCACHLQWLEKTLVRRWGEGVLSNTGSGKEWISTRLHRKQRQKFMDSDPDFVTHTFLLLFFTWGLLESWMRWQISYKPSLWVKSLGEQQLIRAQRVWNLKFL